jgi:hypothetical protein
VGFVHLDAFPSDASVSDFGAHVHEFEDDLDLEPDVENTTFSHGDFQLVGHGDQTNEYCGSWKGYKGCLRTDLHKIVKPNGESYAGKVFVRKVHHWCNKPTCPVCYRSGWAIREAGNIERRLAEASKRWGLVEHIVASVPIRNYGLTYEGLRKDVIKALAERGVVGGVLIFHAFRFSRRRFWYFSPHWHVLGFVLGGYRCRSCKRTCFKGCGGFKDRSYRCFEKDGYIVKVLGERKTVFGTAWYQLNHASIVKGRVRFHVTTWFGVCSYRKLKVTAERRKDVCPICQYELVALDYVGLKRFVTDMREPEYERDSYEDFMENGCVAWRERVKKGGGSYGY